jgi:hypothetical protein
MRGGEHAAGVRLSVGRTGALGHGRRLAEPPGFGEKRCIILMKWFWANRLKALDPRALRVRLRIHKQTDVAWRLVGTPLGVDGWRTDLESETVLLEGASQIQGFLVEINTRVESAR